MRSGRLVELAVVLSVLTLSCSGGGGTAAEDRDITLAEAVAASDVDAVRDLLEAGADPDAPRVNGFTPLMRAALRDEPAIVDLLIGGGADVDATDPEGLTAWHIAAQADAAEPLERLIAHGVDLTQRSRNGMSTAHHAAAGGGVAVLRLLGRLGVDLDATSGVVTQGHGYPRDVGPTPLMIAARAGQMEAVESLLALGVDVNARSEAGHTALLTAVFSDQSSTLVRVLLDAGADPHVEAVCDSGCAREVDARTPLDWARELRRTELIEVLAAAER